MEWKLKAHVIESLDKMLFKQILFLMAILNHYFDYFFFLQDLLGRNPGLKNVSLWTGSCFHNK